MMQDDPFSFLIHKFPFTNAFPPVKIFHSNTEVTTPESAFKTDTRVQCVQTHSNTSKHPKRAVCHGGSPEIKQDLWFIEYHINSSTAK